MAEIKKKLPVFGCEVDVSEVSAKTAVEPFCEYELEDGAKVKVKTVATSFLRVDNQFSPDGSPIYLVFTGSVLSVISAPPEILSLIHI